jgi:hypothetical protein
LIRLPLLSTIRASMTNLLCGESRLNPQESTVVNITLISGRTLYNIEEQQRAVSDKLVLLQTMLDEGAGKASVFETVSKWWKHLLFTIAALKNEHFKEEEF